MPERVIIIGAGGHGKVVADVVTVCGDTVLGFLDDDRTKTQCVGFPVLGSVADAERYLDCRFLLAIGSNEARKNLAERFPAVSWHTAVHPSAIVSPSVSIGAGTVIMPGVIINAEARIGNHCIVNTGAVVEHENQIGDYVHLSPRTALGGNVTVGALCHVGIGASVRNNTAICSGCTVGAGAVVVKNIEEVGVYAGVPARRLHE